MNREFASSLLEYRTMITANTGLILFYELWAIFMIFAIPLVVAFFIMNESLLKGCLYYPRYCPDLLFPREFSCAFKPGTLAGGGKDSINSLCANNLIEYQEMVLLIGIVYFSIGWFLGLIRFLQLLILMCDRCGCGCRK